MFQHFTQFTNLELRAATLGSSLEVVQKAAGEIHHDTTGMLQPIVVHDIIWYPPKCPEWVVLPLDVLYLPCTWQAWLSGWWFQLHFSEMASWSPGRRFHLYQVGEQLPCSYELVNLLGGLLLCLTTIPTSYWHLTKYSITKVTTYPHDPSWTWTQDDFDEVFWWPSPKD